MKKSIEEKAKKIKAIIFDVDGVFFSGSVFISPQGEFLKERSFVDGQGISLLRAIGIRVAFITGEKAGFIESVGEKLNSLPSVKEAQWPKIDIFSGQVGLGKVEVAENWLKDIGATWDECAFMGDDLADYRLLNKVGFSAVPAQAEEIVKNISDFISNRRGGKGAVRDLCDFILSSKGVDPLLLNIK